MADENTKHMSFRVRGVIDIIVVSTQAKQSELESRVITGLQLIAEDLGGISKHVVCDNTFEIVRHAAKVRKHK